MSLETDRALLDGFRRGQRWALEKIYALYADDVAQYLRGGFVFDSGGSTIRYRGAPSEFHLEDWVHDVFLRAFSDSARRQYDGLRPYGPYLQRIARNLVIDELRRKEHQLRAYVEELPEPQVDTDYASLGPCAPDREVERRQLNAHVARFIASQPEREQLVYRLRFVEGLDQREVAAKAGLSPSKVKTSERRIR
ncbi:MAG: sigma-70 family RNA polymerase sigma factor, partial [Myxococcota bacterium]